MYKMHKCTHSHAHICSFVRRSAKWSKEYACAQTNDHEENYLNFRREKQQQNYNRYAAIEITTTATATIVYIKRHQHIATLLHFYIIKLKLCSRFFSY